MYIILDLSESKKNLKVMYSLRINILLNFDYFVLWIE